jgi:hypothetical protein
MVLRFGGRPKFVPGRIQILWLNFIDSQQIQQKLI